MQLHSARAGFANSQSTFSNKKLNVVRANRLEGFTLVELLIVIAVIALLSSLLLPVLASAKSRAMSIKCVSNLRQLALALNVYADDNKFYPLEFGSNANASSFFGYLSSVQWNEELAFHAPGISNCLACPAYRFFHLGSPQPNVYGYNSSGTISVFAKGMSWDGTFGYGLGGKPVYDDDGGIVNGIPTPESAVMVPSDMVAFGDEFQSNGSGYISSGGVGVDRNFFISTADNQLYTSEAYSLHNGQTQCLVLRWPCRITHGQSPFARHVGRFILALEQ